MNSLCRSFLTVDAAPGKYFKLSFMRGHRLDSLSKWASVCSALSWRVSCPWPVHRDEKKAHSCVPAVLFFLKKTSDGPQSPPVVYTGRGIKRNTQWEPPPTLHPLNSPPALPPRPTTSRFTHLCELQVLWCVCLELQVFWTMDFRPSDPCLHLCTLDCAPQRFWVQPQFTLSQCNRMHRYNAFDNADSKFSRSRYFSHFYGCSSLHSWHEWHRIQTVRDKMTHLTRHRHICCRANSQL